MIKPDVKRICPIIMKSTYLLSMLACNHYESNPIKSGALINDLLIYGTRTKIQLTL